MLIPLLLAGALAFAAFAFAEEKTGFLKKIGGGRSLVKFTLRAVPWINPKTGEQGVKDGVPMTREEVVEPPAQLADEASQKLGRKLPVGVFALATLMHSETGNGPDLAKAAVAHATVEMAKKKGTTVIKLLAPDGKFGGQLGRYASTSQPPTEREILLAEMIAAGKLASPAPGALQWDSVLGYHHDPEISRAIAAKVEKKRRSDGMVASYLPGVDPEYLRMWRKA